MRSLPRHAEAPPLASMPHRATPEPSTLTALDDQTLLGLLLGRWALTQVSDLRASAPPAAKGRRHG